MVNKKDPESQAFIDAIRHGDRRFSIDWLIKTACVFASMAETFFVVNIRFFTTKEFLVCPECGHFTGFDPDIREMVHCRSCKNTTFDSRDCEYHTYFDLSDKMAEAFLYFHDRGGERDEL